MAAIFTITDNADGTGATATIAGSAGGSANVVSVSRVNGLSGPLSFAPGGNRTGDGTMALALDKGLWFAYLTSAGAFAGVYYFGVSDGLDAVAARCRRAVCDTIRLLTIDPAARVYEQAFPNASNVEFPCILASVDGVQETFEPILSTRDDIGHPVKIQIADRRDRWDASEWDNYEKWREQIARCFYNQQLAGVPESKICRIEPYVILDPNLPQFEYMVSGLVVRCVCREPRGVGL